MQPASLKVTPLNSEHRLLGAKMVEFGGWDMPINYPTGVIEEHLATRTKAGLFDVSHMGEFWVEGADALKFLNRITSNDVSRLTIGAAQYTILTNEKGGAVDDLLIYCFGTEKYLLVVNAATTEKDWSWINFQLDKNEQVTLKNASSEFCQIAIQGPKAEEILQKLTPSDLSEIKYYHFIESEVAGYQSIISRTGYTGEDGFEVYSSEKAAPALWNAILDAGRGSGLTPCGLAARNTLRLEAAMSLYGHELTDDITPLEANLGWVVKFDKGDFIGRQALIEQKENGLKTKLVGFEMAEPGIARDGYRVFADNKPIGVVSSGSPAPFLKKNIGLAFVPVEFSGPGQEVYIEIRNKLVKANIVKTPFYKRPK